MQELNQISPFFEHKRLIIEEGRKIERRLTDDIEKRPIVKMIFLGRDAKFNVSAHIENCQ